MRIPHKRQGGQVLVMVALSAVVLIASVGLAIDSALGYFVKAKLNAAVDAASLAAARGVTAGSSEEAQRASARRSARDFFDINYPDHFLLSTPTLDPVDVTFDRGTVTIDVSASASLPVSLMGVLGFKTLNVAASAQTIRKDLDMVLVMDTSRSLENNADAVRAAGKSFLNKFNSTVDRVGLLHFASEAQIDVPIRQVERGFDRGGMTMKGGKIDQFTFVGGTNSSAGMFQARKQLNDIAQVDRSSLRVIVFFSDGSPAAFSAYFPNKDNKCEEAGGLATFPKLQNPALAGLYRMKVSDSLQYGDCAASQITALPAWYNANNDAARREFPIVTNTPRVVTASTASAQAQWTNVHRASRNLVEAMAAKARQEGIFVFTLGMGASLKTREGPDNELGEDLLRCLANTTDAKAACRKPAEPVGLYCYAATESELSPCFTRLASAILRISR
ncbi:VWA domain-containing protein [Janthinobacterium rivuli]|uniref:vWA domain-containing protein n=1 Tax=Janthinobacterium sp. FT68W TaxID=2654255 RepID=UPI001263EF99|nr:VWA domain-containing protein [Janthinobacterium sp. FT68W]KAB8045569.1 VWA domain-containing protein [Janthinobacterium sp. FT68W]